MHLVKTSVSMSRSPEPLFQGADYVVVRRAMQNLSRTDQTIVQLRFWHQYSIREIAGYLKLGWEEVHDRLASSLRCLRAVCEAEPGFSRARAGIDLKAA